MKIDEMEIGINVERFKQPQPQLPPQQQQQNQQQHQKHHPKHQQQNQQHQQLNFKVDNNSLKSISADNTKLEEMCSENRIKLNRNLKVNCPHHHHQHHNLQNFFSTKICSQNNSQQLSTQHQPFHTATQQPIHTATQQPFHPSTQQPIHPATQQPIHPTTQQPIHPTTQQPIHPTTQQPIHPTTQQTIHPTTQQPFHPSTQQPFHPSTQQTIHPTTQQPFHQSTQQPFHPSTQQPIHPSTQQPIHLSTQQPIHPSTQQPFHPSTQQTIHPTTQQTIHPSTQQTIHTATHQKKTHTTQRQLNLTTTQKPNHTTQQPQQTSQQKSTKPSSHHRALCTQHYLTKDTSLKTLAHHHIPNAASSDIFHSRLLCSIFFLFFTIFHPSSAIDTVCQEPTKPGSSTINYSVCMAVSQKILLPNNTIYQLVVEPPTITCGETLQPYCTSALPMQCFNCSSTTPTLSHPKEFLTDLIQGSNNQPNYKTSWQSQTWSSLGSRPVATIRISMGRRFILQDDIVFRFDGGFPKVAILEKSTDTGTTWIPFQYFNRSCSDANIKTTITTATDVICTEEYSTANPVMGGDMRFNLNRDRLKIYLGETFTDYPKLFEAYEDTNLIEFLSFTDLRLRLIYPATDGNEFSGNALELLKYYYALSNIYLVGSCDCNQHAKFCEPIVDRMMCVCEHNTDGQNCEMCLPLYNNRPWKAGSFKQRPNALPLTGTANECQKCECYNKATRCSFESSTGKGRCLDCGFNSQGDNCDECKFAFFRNSTSTLYDLDMCSVCVCEPLGIVDNDKSCLDITGQCRCKPGVLGTSCSVCFDGTWGLLTNGSTQGVCKACACNIQWTIDNKNSCDQLTGQCNCITGVQSTNCTLCKDGFYRKKSSDVQQTCVPCLCNWGGSADQTCNKSTSQCPCKANLIGNTCSTISPNFYTPLPDYISLKPDYPSTLTTCVQQTDLQSSPILFSGKFYYLCFANATNQLATFSDILAAVPKQGSLSQTYIPILRFGLEGSRNYGHAQLTIAPDGQNPLFNETKYPEANSTQCNSAYLASTFNLFDLYTGFGNAVINTTATVQLDARCKYKATLRAMNAGGSVNPIILDSLVLLPYYKSSLFYVNKVSDSERKQYEMCINNLLALFNRNLTELISRSECSELYFSMMTEQAGKALACDCDVVGTKTDVECQSLGGQCDCQENVGGRRCESCFRGFYGFSATGCQACACDQDGSSSPVCDYTTGQCPCRGDVAMANETSSNGLAVDTTCTYCKQNFYGVSSKNGCLACNCDADGSVDLQCNASGVCTCNETIGGTKCDQCLPGYYGFSSTGCSKCECDKAGSVNGSCSNTGTCLCKNNAEGLKCELCKPNTFNLASTNPDGCQPCYCSKLGQGDCQSAVGFTNDYVQSADVTTWTIDPQFKSHLEAPAPFYGNRISSYAQNLSFAYYPSESFVIGRELVVALTSKDQRKLSYSPTNLTFVGLQTLSMNILLHEAHFYDVAKPTIPLTALDMYDVLSQLSSLSIQQTFLDKYPVGVSQVSLTAAKPSNPGDESAAHVENCTCLNSTAGLSCERCLQGFKRKDASVEDSQCVVCSCLGLTPATQQCDQLSGKCLNCPNGSLGDSCDVCAPNVVKASNGQCDQCAPNHWGLSQDGCLACNCTSPGTVDISSCDLLTGQCACRSNVTGRTCEDCMDGFINMTVVGCSPCGGCYGLVVKEMDKLMVMLRNQTMTYVEVSSNLPTNFTLRLNNALSQADFLNKYNIAFDLENSTLHISLHNTSELYKALDNFLTTTIKPKWDVLESLQGATNSSQHSIQQVLKDITESLVIVSLATPAMQTNADKLTALKNSIENIKNLLGSGIQPLIFGFNALNNTVTQIETDAQALSVVINDIRSTKVPGAVGQNQQIKDAFLSIEATLQSLNHSAFGLKEAANKVKKNGAYLTASTTLLFNKIRDIEMSSIDVQGVSNNVSLFLPNLAKQLTASAQGSQREAGLLEADINNITTVTNMLLSSVDTHLQQVEQLGNRVDAANDTAYGSVETAQATVASSLIMLDVMRNFNAKSTALQSQAAVSIQSAQDILGMTQQAINSSRGISSSIQPSIDTSNLALASTTSFLVQCQTFRENIQPVHSKSTSLFSEAAAQLNDVTLKQQTASISPSKTFNPLLSNQQSRAGQLENMALNLRDNIQSVVGNFSSSKQQLQTLINKINAVVPPVTAQTTSLLTECQTLKQTFQQMSLSSTVVQLQSASSIIQGWVGELKNKKTQLQRHVTRLRVVLGQLV